MLSYNNYSLTRNNFFDILSDLKHLQNVEMIVEPTTLIPYLPSLDNEIY